jgi:hypothetical protein
MRAGSGSTWASSGRGRCGGYGGEMRGWAPLAGGCTFSPKTGGCLSENNRPLRWPTGKKIGERWPCILMIRQPAGAPTAVDNFGPAGRKAPHRGVRRDVVTQMNQGSKSAIVPESEPPACFRPCSGRHTFPSDIACPSQQSTQAMRCRHSAGQARAAADIAVDMMDNASALPTCPQRQQLKKTALRKWPKITHTTSRRGSILNPVPSQNLTHGRNRSGFCPMSGGNHQACSSGRSFEK